MDLIELESLAVDSYRRHGFDPSEPTSTFCLARKMLRDPNAITRPPTLLGRYPACTYHVHGRPKIGLRRTVAHDDEQFFVGHELAHLIVGRPHGAGAEIEAACDYLGAALVAPRPAVIALHRVFAWDLAAIAEEVVATQSWAALRLGEALGLPLALVSPASVRVRGPEEWVWPDERTIRTWAREESRPGLAKISVTDRARRTVLAAS